MPRSHWGWGVAALPTVVFGVVALYWAAQVDPRVRSGDVLGARRASSYARRWGIAGVVALALVLVVALLPASS